MRAEADQIDVVTLGVIQNLPIRLAFADCMSDLTPQMRLCRYRLGRLRGDKMLGDRCLYVDTPDQRLAHPANGGQLTIPSGTKVPLALKQSISTKNARDGDAV